MSGQLIKPSVFAREVAEAESVPELAELARKADALIDYMRGAGRYDFETVQEFCFGKAEAVRRAGALLEQMAPDRLGRRGGINDTGVVYFETIKDARLHKKSAERWRAAARFPADKFEAFKEKLRKKGELLKLTDLYRLGKPEQARARVKVVAEATGAYPILYADPPWQYEHPPMGATGRSIEAHYPTMTVAELKALKVPATDDAVLFLWATAPKLPECLDLMEAWGFLYRTNAVWVKDKIGTGYYVRNQHEHILIGRRGELPVPDPGTQPSSVFDARRLAHSEKPIVVYEAIERMYPNLPKIELFARESRDGWTSWGNQAPEAA